MNCLHTLFFSNGSLSFWLYPRSPSKVSIVSEAHLKLKIAMFNFCMARRPVRHLKELGDYETFYDMPEKQGNQPYRFLLKIKTRPLAKETAKLAAKPLDYHVASDQ